MSLVLAALRDYKIPTDAPADWDSQKPAGAGQAQAKG